MTVFCVCFQTFVYPTWEDSRRGAGYTFLKTSKILPEWWEEKSMKERNDLWPEAHHIICQSGASIIAGLCKNWVTTVYWWCDCDRSSKMNSKFSDLIHSSVAKPVTVVFSCTNIQLKNLKEHFKSRSDLNGTKSLDIYTDMQIIQTTPLSSLSV